jgi:hypothetical protein
VLATLLVAQLLERLLRLLDLAASAGAPLSSVVVMVANLVPHYLGLALPMAFTAAIFIAAARMSDDCELDVMLSTGRSIARIAAPYFCLAALLIPFSAYLHGQVQPVTRYGYRLAVYEAMQTGWNAKVEENRFIDAGKGATFSAREVDADGSHLRGVFVERRSPHGGDRDHRRLLRPVRARARRPRHQPQARPGHAPAREGGPLGLDRALRAEPDRPQPAAGAPAVPRARRVGARAHPGRALARSARRRRQQGGGRIPRSVWRGS